MISFNKFAGLISAGELHTKTEEKPALGIGSQQNLLSLELSRVEPYPLADIAYLYLAEKTPDSHKGVLRERRVLEIPAASIREAWQAFRKDVEFEIGFITRQLETCRQPAQRQRLENMLIRLQVAGGS